MAHRPETESGALRSPIHDDFAESGVIPDALNALRRTLDASHGRSERRDATASFEAGLAPEVRGEIVAPARGNRRIPTLHTRRPTSWMRGAALFAAACILVGIGTLLHRSSKPVKDMKTAVYATSTGQRATVTLRDGTRVTLAPQTTVRLIDFGTAARTIQLDGEAHFDVTQTRGAPFIVQTGAITTRVLGTAFTVRRYAEDRNVRVAVMSGKVSVAAHSQRNPSLTLTAGTVGNVTDSTATSRPVSDVAPYTGWMSDRLVFHMTATTEVLATLTRWYGYEFRLADSTLAKQDITAGISTRSSAEAIATLKLLLDVDVTAQGRVLTLHPRRARRAIPRRDSDMKLESPFRTEVGR